jgi:hypothetical protein
MDWSRVITMSISNPRAALAATYFKCMMNADKEFRKTWRLIRQTKGFLSKSESYALYFLAKNVTQNGSLVEIGSYEGRSTIALAAGAEVPGVKVYAIDPHTGAQSGFEHELKIDTWGSFCENTKSFSNIHPIKKLSVDAIGDLGPEKIELQFIDGWHSENAVDEDINFYLPFMAFKFTIVFDDWGDPGVSAGITKNLTKLPPVIGIVGKDLIFSNNEFISKSLIARCIKWKTPKNLLMKYTIV